MWKGPPGAECGRSLSAGGEDHRCCGTDRLFAGRREIKRLTGNYKVPTLILDGGTVIDDSSNIVAWAQANPA